MQIDINHGSGVLMLALAVFILMLRRAGAGGAAAPWWAAWLVLSAAGFFAYADAREQAGAPGAAVLPAAVTALTYAVMVVGHLLYLGRPLRPRTIAAGAAALAAGIAVAGELFGERAFYLVNGSLAGLYAWLALLFWRSGRGFARRTTAAVMAARIPVFAATVGARTGDYAVLPSLAGPETWILLSQGLLALHALCLALLEVSAARAEAKAAHDRLEDEVRARTAELRAAAVELEAKARQLEDRVREREAAEERLRGAIDAMPAGVLIYDAGMRLVARNDRAAADHPPAARPWTEPGSLLTDLVDAHYREHYAASLGRPYEPAEVAARMAALAGGEVPPPLQIDLWDGRSAVIISGRTADGGLVQVFQDVTGIRRSEADLRDTLDALHAGVVLWDADRRLKVVNRRTAEIFPDVAHLLTAGADYRAVSAAMAAAGYARPEHVREHWVAGAWDRRLADGRTLEVRLQPTAGGGAVVVYEDVTVERLASERLAHAERMQSLGTLVAGVAHEVNTPVGVALTAVSHAGDLAAELRAASREGRLQAAVFRRCLDGVEEGARIAVQNLERASSIVGAFKQIAADQVSRDVRSVRAGDYVADVLRSLAPETRRRGAEVTLDVRGDAEILTRPGALAQVLTNLVVNALDHAFPDGRGGRIDVSVRAPGESGASVRISVADDGVGVPEDALRRIFEPFYTTRRGRGGIGLGLAVVDRLVVDALGGRVAVRNLRGGDGPAGFAVDIDLPGRAPAADAGGGGFPRG